MDEEVVRRRFWAAAYRHGVPRAQDIGQDETVSSAKMDALDAAAHDVEVFVAYLAGRSRQEALDGFAALQEQLRTPTLRAMGLAEFRSRFLRGVA